MRIIDADTLKAYFFRPYSNEEFYSNIDIEKIIDEQITVKPERKTGKWIADGCIDICSECGASRVNQLWDDYCGRCGAKMEVDE